MTTSDIMTLAWPVIAAVAMSALGFDAIYSCGYHRPVPSRSGATADSASALSKTINHARLVPFLLSLSEAELNYVAERSAEMASRAKAQRETTRA